MRFIFTSYTYPGPLAPMATWLAAQPENHVIFAATRFRQENPLPNVQRVVMKKYQSKGTENGTYLDLWDEAIRAAKSAASSLEIVRNSGYKPDIIFNASSNGVLLGGRQVFPDAFIINFLEKDNFTKPFQAEIRKTLQTMQILESGLNFTFSSEIKNIFPPEIRGRIALAPRMVDAEFFNAAHAKPFTSEKFAVTPRELLTIFCSGVDRNLVEMCELILTKRPKCHIEIVADNGFALRQLADVSIKNNPERFDFMRMPGQEILRNLLCSTSLAMFMDNSAHILETLSCSTPACYFFNDDSLPETVLPMDEKGAEARANSIINYLGQKNRLAKLGEIGRRIIDLDYDAYVVMPKFYTNILESRAKVCAS